MYSIRIHGRGGQGGKKLSTLIALSAFKEGKQVQAFALYGAERRGAPVVSFVRIDDDPIEIRGYVTKPDCIIVLDDSLMYLAKEGAENSTLIINSNKEIDSAITVDITQIGIDVIGKPIVNTGMLGAFTKVTGLISLTSAQEAIQDAFSSMPQKIIDKNIKACIKTSDVI